MAAGVLQGCKVDTNGNLANAMTKRLSRDVRKSFLFVCGLTDSQTIQ